MDDEDPLNSDMHEHHSVTYNHRLYKPCGYKTRGVVILLSVGHMCCTFVNITYQVVHSHINQ